jgi:hypothetical protein
MCTYHNFTQEEKNICHCLYHTSARIGIHALLQADVLPSEHHKPPTHLQFYCHIKSVELSWAQFDYMVYEEVWWSLREIWTLNPEVQASNPSTNNDMLKLSHKLGTGHSNSAVVLHLKKVSGPTPSIDKISWCYFLLFKSDFNNYCKGDQIYNSSWRLGIMRYFVLSSGAQVDWTPLLTRQSSRI